MLEWCVQVCFTLGSAYSSMFRIQLAFSDISIYRILYYYISMYAARFKTSGSGRRFRSVPDRADVFGQPLRLHVFILHVCMLQVLNEKTETASITSKIRRQAWHTSLISCAAEKTEL